MKQFHKWLFFSTCVKIAFAVSPFLNISGLYINPG